MITRITKFTDKKLKNMKAKIIEKIEQSQKIAIFCHENPDWDAIGSLLWLGTLLENMWKNITYIAPTKPSKIFGFLPWFNKIQSEFDYWNYDLIILVDCSELARIWTMSKWKEDYFNEQDVVVFDHHELKEREKNRIIKVDPKATSCCEVIFETVQKCRKEYITPEVATCFYLWLTTDSGNFRFDEDHERIFTNALNLIKFWANKKLITDNLTNSKALETIQFFKVLLERMKIEWNILYTYYDIDELKDHWIDNEQAGYGLTVIQEIRWPKITMTIRKEWDMIKCSMRSKNTDIAKITQQFGWWWHIHAAWFSRPIEKDFETTIKEIVTKLNKMLE